ncbi:HopJ type III effector protein [Flavobacterium gelidilacus]|uniref:HopJ type III effector protein n=1 Tax=Flavobacterium gelidilacus TaxID=206041 RepID=UPI000420DFCB|nr:HopJ type III effector protein [Flavobacterium gelidilacus]
MTVLELIDKVKQAEVLIFSDVLETIDGSYNFIPTKFINGNVINEANTNNGSCKVFSFAKMLNLSSTETLFLFGEHYQKVLATPKEDDHQNIRNFMQFGWEAISFEENALDKKNN